MTPLAYTRACGSTDVYLIADAHRWYVVSGVELSEVVARWLAEVAGTSVGAVAAPGSLTTVHEREDDARRAFEERGR